MKLKIGENIREFRKKNDLTQEEFADRLGVTYQSVSRWENGTTYPDLELLPAISEALSITLDELLGMPQAEKEKRAEEAFDALRRECMKKDYDKDRIVALLRDIRRNYLNSEHAYRPWVEGNGPTFRDPAILPEVRLLAEAYLERYPMDPHAIETMAEAEDEEHLATFLKNHTTSFDCSERALLFRRYSFRGDAERFEPERRYQLYDAIAALLCPRYLLKWGGNEETRNAADQFMESILSLVRGDAADDRPDMWLEDRIELGLKSAMRSCTNGRTEEALAKLESVVRLLEETMKITEETLLPTSCRFLDGMEWTAKVYWTQRHNDPDEAKERVIHIVTRMNNMATCSLIIPANYLDWFNGKAFDPIRRHPEFEKLTERVKALIVTKTEDSE